MLKFVRNGELLRGVVYKTSNVVIQKVQQGTKRDRCFIIGSGYTLNVDEENRITWHDPAMIKQEYDLSKDITIYTFYYTYACEGLEPAAKEIATFVNGIFKDFERLFLIGHSKCGLCMCKVTEFLKDLVTLATISTPLKGTIMADQAAIAKIVKSKALMWLYRKIFSNHNVDLDIVPDSDFLRNIKEPKCKEHINIVSRLESRVYFSPIDNFLLFVDRVLKLGGDGVVPFASQWANTEKQIVLNCSHAGSLKKGLEIIDKYSKLMN